MPTNLSKYCETSNGKSFNLVRSILLSPQQIFLPKRTKNRIHSSRFALIRSNRFEGSFHPSLTLLRVSISIPVPFNEHFHSRAERHEREQTVLHEEVLLRGDKRRGGQPRSKSYKLCARFLIPRFESDFGGNRSSNQSAKKCNVIETQTVHASTWNKGKTERKREGERYERETRPSVGML